MTDLEADVEDPNEISDDEDLEIREIEEAELVTQTNGPRPARVANGEYQNTTNTADDTLAETTAVQLSLRDDHALTPSVTATSDPTNASTNASSTLLDRRGAPQMSSPFSLSESRTAPVNPERIEYLRPITPTEPLVVDSNLPATSLQTPTTDQLVPDGPMTPTNNAGPFVFDGSAGRAS